MAGDNRRSHGNNRKKGNPHKHVYKRQPGRAGGKFPGSHHCTTCGKWSYQTRDDAEAAAKQMHPGSPMRFYKCLPEDRWWHFTSMTAGQVGRIRERQAVTEDEEDEDEDEDDTERDSA